MRDEKLHAIVARSTFPSQNVQSTPGSDHFWKFRCPKSASRCGAKHISKSKCTKHLSSGPLLEGSDVEKVHAVVARSPFPSQNVQNTSAPDHFWKLRCRKSASRCGAKHISKSKCTKHLSSGPLLEGSDVEKVHAVVARSTCPSQNVKNTRVSDHFWRFRCRFASLHYTTLHYTTLQSTTLHYITLHSTTLQLQLHNYTTTQLHNYTTTQLHNYIALHSTTLNYTPQHSTTLNYTTVHYTPLHYTTLHYTPLHSSALNYTTLHYTTLHYIPLHSTTLHYNYNYTTTLRYTQVQHTTLHYTTLHSTTLHYTTLHYHYTSLHYTTLHSTR